MESTDLKGKLFSLFKQKGKSPYWYVRYKNPITGKFDSKGAVVSTKCKTKGEAEKWAIAHVDEYIQSKEFSDSFENFTKDFFTVNSTWYINKQGKKPPKKKLASYNSIFKKHVYPFFQSYTLSEINKFAVREFRTSVAKLEICGGYKNIIVILLRYILQEAEAQGKIDSIPRIDGFVNHSKEKGILTDDEVERLFATPFEDKRVHVVNLILCYCGMRIGEVLSLRPCDIDLNKRIIKITRSFDTGLRIQNEKTKSGKNRVCPIPDFLVTEINELISMNPYKDEKSYLFYGDDLSEPMYITLINRRFHQKLKAIGVDAKARNITLHSYRHRFNSKLINSGINILRVQSVIGHSSNAMSENYHHIDMTDDFTDIRNIQNMNPSTLQ